MFLLFLILSVDGRSCIMSILTASTLRIFYDRSGELSTVYERMLFIRSIAIRMCAGRAPNNRILLTFYRAKITFRPPDKGESSNRKSKRSISNNPRHRIVSSFFHPISSNNVHLSPFFTFPHWRQFWLIFLTAAATLDPWKPHNVKIISSLV